MRLARFLVSLITLIVLAGCSLPTRLPFAHEPPFTPTFDESVCPFAAPAFRLPFDPTLHPAGCRCGFGAVPVHPYPASGPTIRLAVVVYRADHPTDPPH